MGNPARMKGVEWEGKPFSVSVKEIERPKVQQALDIVVRLTTSGICGTDLHTLHGRLATKAPLTLGHESIGIVEEIGEGVLTLKKGDRVLVYDGLSCGFCKNCVGGLTAFCLTINPPSDLAIFGVGEPTRQFNGGQAQYIRVPWAAESTFLLPPGTEHELDYLLLSDIWPTAWSCLDFAGFQPGDSVTVFGAGPVGLLCAYSALLRGASTVYSVDHVPQRLAKAKSIGSIPINFKEGDPVAQIMKFEPSGTDRSCDCVGFECVDADGKNVTNEVLVNAINVSKVGGGIGVIGVYTPQDKGAPDALSAKGILELPIGTWWFKNLSIKGGPVSIRNLIPQLKTLIDSGKAKPSFVFDKEITIEEAAKAYTEFSDHDFIKAHIRFDGHGNGVVPKKRKKME